MWQSYWIYISVTSEDMLEELKLIFHHVVPELQKEANKRRVRIIPGALYICKRALKIRKRAQNICKRDSYISITSFSNCKEKPTNAASASFQVPYIYAKKP